MAYEPPQGGRVHPSVLQFQLVERGAQLFSLVIKCGLFAWLGYCVVLAVGELAGKVTDAQISIVVGYLTKTKGGATVTVALLAGVLGVVYGFIQRKLRQRTIADFAEYRRKIEEKYDSDRSSSMLTQRGDTNPVDR